MKTKNTKFLLWTGFLMIVLITAATIAGIHYLRRHIPAEIIPDIRAAIDARNLTDPDARLNKYLTGLYGSLDDPAHRERAFEDFFNPNHIKAMQIIVKHSPADQRLANIQAMARWIANYRQSMSPQEKSALGDYFQSSAGQTSLQDATAQFMSQDGIYRSATVPVITELMTTLNAVKR